jgi:nicotinamide-nucleotide amidase
MIPGDADLERLAGAVKLRLLARGETVTTAESCTGGWIAKVLTDLAGSSAIFTDGFVTYSNAAKTRRLDVPAATLIEHGAVSEPVVIAMTAGALAKSGCDHAIAVSGIAGPDGGSADKPVGTVWLAWATAGGDTVCERRVFDGNREEVRRATVARALRGLLAGLDDAD